MFREGWDKQNTWHSQRHHFPVLLFPCILTHRLFTKKKKRAFHKQHHLLQTRESNMKCFLSHHSFFSLLCSPLLCSRTPCPFPGLICLPFSHSRMSPLSMALPPLLPPLCSFCQLCFFSSACGKPRARDGEKTQLPASIPAFPWGML